MATSGALLMQQHQESEAQRRQEIADCQKALQTFDPKATDVVAVRHFARCYEQMNPPRSSPGQERAAEVFMAVLVVVFFGCWVIASIRNWKRQPQYGAFCACTGGFLFAVMVSLGFCIVAFVVALGIGNTA